MIWGVAAALTILLPLSLVGNAALYFRLQIARKKLKAELAKPAPEPRVIVERLVIEKPVPVSVNHIESRGLGGSNTPLGPPTGFVH